MTDKSRYILAFVLISALCFLALHSRVFVVYCLCPLITSIVLPKEPATPIKYDGVRTSTLILFVSIIGLVMVLLSQIPPAQMSVLTGTWYFALLIWMMLQSNLALAYFKRKKQLSGSEAAA